MKLAPKKVWEEEPKKVFAICIPVTFHKNGLTKKKKQFTALLILA